MAEETKATTEEAQDPTQTDAGKPNTDEPGKTFTQAELDKVIADRLARERAKMPAADKLKAFNEWEKSQQTEAEKAVAREKELASLQSEAENLRREKAIILAGVKGDDVDYVMFKVGKLDGDFSKNLATFLTENKKFTEPETTTVDGVKHSPGSTEKVSGVETEFLKRNPGLKIE